MNIIQDPSSVKAIKASSKSSPVGSWKINFGKYTGFTYQEIKRDDLEYLVYLLEKGAYDDAKYREVNNKIKHYILN
jgi:hypothetical protein